MKEMPQLDVRWRRFSINARGREAIDAIRKPLFVVLIANAAVAIVAMTALVVRPDWLAVKDVVTTWLR